MKYNKAHIQIHLGSTPYITYYRRSTYTEYTAHCSPTLDRPLHLEIHSRGRYWILLGTLFSLSPQLPIFSFFLSWLNAILEPICPL